MGVLNTFLVVMFSVVLFALFVAVLIYVVDRVFTMLSNMSNARDDPPVYKQIFKKKKQPKLFIYQDPKTLMYMVVKKDFFGRIWYLSDGDMKLVRDRNAYAQLDYARTIKFNYEHGTKVPHFVE